MASREASLAQSGGDVAVAFEQQRTQRRGEHKGFGRGLFRAAEHALCDSPLSRFAGFYVAAYEKRESVA